MVSSHGTVYVPWAFHIPYEPTASRSAGSCRGYVLSQVVTAGGSAAPNSLILNARL